MALLAEGFPYIGAAKALAPVTMESIDTLITYIQNGAALPGGAPHSEGC